MSTPPPGRRRALVHVTTGRIEINAWPLLVVDVELDPMRRQLSSIALPMALSPTTAAPELRKAADRFVSGASDWWKTRQSDLERLLGSTVGRDSAVVRDRSETPGA
jgi:hypothetical protein